MKKSVGSNDKKPDQSLQRMNQFKISFTLIFAFLFFNTNHISAQRFAENSEPVVQQYNFTFSDSLKVIDELNQESAALPDSAVQVHKRKLLPDNISFMERTLWGENGLIRQIGLSGPLTPETRKHELGIRRVMLTAHQIGGFTTLALMLATCYYGQKIIDGGVEGRRNYESTKNALVSATMVSYSLTALLAILSPPPFIRRDETSTTTIHKTLAWFHVAGMILTPILGSLIQSHRTFNEDKARVHQVAGYITTALFATSLIVITF